MHHCIQDVAACSCAKYYPEAAAAATVGEVRTANWKHTERVFNHHNTQRERHTQS